MERNFERDLNGMAAEREHNLEEYYAYMAVRVLDGCGAGPCDGEPCGMPDWIRTSGLWSRSPTLYPTELRAHISFNAP
jgi:hypothetical protein